MPFLPSLLFLLSVLLTTTFASGLFIRPTQADILHPVYQTPSTAAGCLLNIGLENGLCPAPATDPNPMPIGSTNLKVAPATDPTPPTVAVQATPNTVGGASQVVTITGNVADKTLSSYVLKVNDTVVQQVSNLTAPSAAVSATWNVSMPNKVPSGTYTISLTATDKEGTTATATMPIIVDNDGPTVSITGGDVIIKSGSISPVTTADDPRGVAFYAWTAAADNPGVPLKFNELVARPTFTPIVEGSYSFTLMVTDTLGNFTTKTFAFGYAQKLAIVPLPTTQNPIDQLVERTPAQPATVPARIQPTSPSGLDAAAAGNSAVLGSTSAAPDRTAPIATAATIAPTTGGWSIFGLLWYWWLIVIGGLFIVWLLVKKFIVDKIPENS